MTGLGIGIGGHKSDPLKGEMGDETVGGGIIDGGSVSTGLAPTIRNHRLNGGGYGRSGRSVG